MKKEKIEEIHNFLLENDYIKSGSIIETDILKELFGCDDVESLEYVGPLILLIKEIEKYGLFAKAADHCIKIFTENEAPMVAKRRCQKAQRINENTLETLKQLDVSNITNKDEKQKYLHQLNLFSMLNRQSKIVFEQTRIYEVDE